MALDIRKFTRRKYECFYYVNNGDNGGGGGGGPTPPPGGGSGGGHPFVPGTSNNQLGSSAGLQGFDRRVLMPLQDANGNTVLGYFDFSNFNSQFDSYYTFRQEELMEGRKITISRVRIVYMPMSIQGPLEVYVLTDDNPTPVIGVNGKSITLDGNSAINRPVTKYADIIVTGERPQLYLKRTANSGEVKIISATMITDVEIMEQV